MYVSSMQKLLYSREHRLLIKRLVQARKKAGLSQTQAAQRLGTSQPNISMVESGQRRIGVVELLKFAKVYECTLTELLGSLLR